MLGSRLSASARIAAMRMALSLLDSRIVGLRKLKERLDLARPALRQRPLDRGQRRLVGIALQLLRRSEADLRIRRGKLQRGDRGRQLAAYAVVEHEVVARIRQRRDLLAGHDVGRLAVLDPEHRSPAVWTSPSASACSTASASASPSARELRRSRAPCRRSRLARGRAPAPAAARWRRLRAARTESDGRDPQTDHEKRTAPAW